MVILIDASLPSPQAKSLCQDAYSPSKLSPECELSRPCSDTVLTRQGQAVVATQCPVGFRSGAELLQQDKTKWKACMLKR